MGCEEGSSVPAAAHAAAPGAHHWRQQVQLPHGGAAGTDATAPAVAALALAAAPPPAPRSLGVQPLQHSVAPAEHAGPLSHGHGVSQSGLQSRHRRRPRQSCLPHRRHWWQVLKQCRQHLEASAWGCDWQPCSLRPPLLLSLVAAQYPALCVADGPLANLLLLLQPLAPAAVQCGCQMLHTQHRWHYSVAQHRQLAGVLLQATALGLVWHPLAMDQVQQPLLAPGQAVQAPAVAVAVAVAAVVVAAAEPQLATVVAPELIPPWARAAAACCVTAMQ